MKVKIDFGTKFEAKGQNGIPTFIKPNVINVKGGGGNKELEMPIDFTFSFEEIDELSMPLNANIQLEAVNKNNPYGNCTPLFFKCDGATYTPSTTQSVSEPCYIFVLANGEQSSSITPSGDYELIYNGDIDTFRARIYKCKSSMSISASVYSSDSWNSGTLVVIKLPLAWNISGEDIYKKVSGDNYANNVSESLLEDDKLYVTVASASCRYSDNISNAACFPGSYLPSLDPDMIDYYWAYEVLGSNRGRGDFVLVLANKYITSHIWSRAYDWSRSTLRVIGTNL